MFILHTILKYYHCKSKDIIEQYLSSTYISFQMEDFDISPTNYENPTIPIIQSLFTSFGKTLIVKEYIYRTKPNCVVFIVPTNALAYEVENDLRTNSSFDDYDVFDRVKTDSTSDFSKKLLFVGTQEKFSEWRSIFDRNIDLFIIDEAYKLKDPIASNQRSYILIKSFNLIFNNNNLLFKNNLFYSKETNNSSLKSIGSPSV